MVLENVSNILSSDMKPVMDSLLKAIESNFNVSKKTTVFLNQPQSTNNRTAQNCQDRALNIKWATTTGYMTGAPATTSAWYFCFSAIYSSVWGDQVWRERTYFLLTRQGFGS